MGNSLFHGDALSLLERLPSGEAALAYLDPPTFPDPSSDDASLREHLLFISRVLQQVARILTDSGSIFFHSSPAFSGGVRPLLDQAFGHRQFRAEIIWPYKYERRTQHNTIYRYGKTDRTITNPVARPLTPEEVRATLTNTNGERPYLLHPLTRRDPGRPALRFEWNGFTPPPGQCWAYGKATLDAMQARGEIVANAGGSIPRAKRFLDKESDLAVDVGSVWDDLSRAPIDRKFGYPTQKPLALLERIIGIGTNQGDLVLDPFCGSGVGLVAAQKMGRRWIGCDSADEAQSLTLERLEKSCHLARGQDFQVLTQEEWERDFPVLHHAYRPTLLHVGQPSGKELIEQGEGLDLEFKALLRGTMSANKDGYDLEYACFKTISALMNTRGGMLLVGVKDDGQVIGIEKDGFANNDKFMTHFWHMFESAIGKPHSGFVQTAFEALDGKSVFIVRCQKSDSPVFLKYKRASGNEKVEEFFVRTGPSSERLGMQEAFDYIRKHFEVSA